MEFEKKDWKKFHYKSGIIGELTLKENKRVIENIKFSNNNEYKRVLGIMKAYGFTSDENFKKETEEEEKELNRHKGFLDKDMEW
jgi:hypothetical protein